MPEATWQQKRRERRQKERKESSRPSASTQCCRMFLFTNKTSLDSSLGQKIFTVGFILRKGCQPGIHQTSAKTLLLLLGWEGPRHEPRPSTTGPLKCDHYMPSPRFTLKRVTLTLILTREGTSPPRATTPHPWEYTVATLRQPPQKGAPPPTRIGWQETNWCGNLLLLYEGVFLLIN